MIGISSKTGQGIDELLEQILLQAEMLELKYNPNRSAVGVVVDSYKDEKHPIAIQIFGSDEESYKWEISFLHTIRMERLKE